MEQTKTKQSLSSKTKTKREKVKENIIADHLRIYQRKLETVEKQLKAGQPVIKGPCRHQHTLTVKEIEEFLIYGPKCPDSFFTKKPKSTLSSELEAYPPDDPFEIIKALDLFEERLMQQATKDAEISRS